MCCRCKTYCALGTNFRLNLKFQQFENVHKHKPNTFSPPWANTSNSLKVCYGFGIPIGIYSTFSCLYRHHNHSFWRMPCPELIKKMYIVCLIIYMMRPANNIVLKLQFVHRIKFLISIEWLARHLCNSIKDDLAWVFWAFHTVNFSFKWTRSIVENHSPWFSWFPFFLIPLRHNRSLTKRKIMLGHEFLTFSTDIRIQWRFQLTN